MSPMDSPPPLNTHSIGYAASAGVGDVSSTRALRDPTILLAIVEASDFLPEVLVR